MALKGVTPIASPVIEPISNKSVGVNFSFIQPQADIHQNNAKFVALISGSGIGKTAYGGCWLYSEIEKNPKGKFIGCAPTYKMLAQATWVSVMDVINMSPFAGGVVRRVDKEYELPTGGMIYFRSMEDPDSIQGIHADAIFFDEAGKCSRQCWHVIQQRVTQSGGRVFLASTPYPEHTWLKDEVLKAYEEDDPDYYVRVAKTMESPYADLKQIEKRRKEWPEWKFKNFYEAEWSEHSVSLVYPDFGKCIVDQNDFDVEGGTTILGVDWGGGGDPWVALICIFDENDVCWVVGERCIRGQFDEHHYEWITSENEKATQMGMPIEMAYADASGRSSIHNYLMNTGILFLAASNAAGAVQYRINKVTSRIRTSRLKVLRQQCPNLIKAAGLYRYPINDDGEPIGRKPLHDGSDCLDALGYAISEYDRNSVSNDTYNYDE